MLANLRQRMKRVLTWSGELEVSRSMVASITRETDISEEKVTNCGIILSLSFSCMLNRTCSSWP